jgi:hypothetical protein
MATIPHPRPDFMRDTFVPLDGAWAFGFDDDNVGLAERWYDPAFKLPRTIEVPYCYQCERGGIGGDEIHPYMWYAKRFSVPKEIQGKRALLRFGAVDWSCVVYINGQRVGEHTGGYTPFAIDATAALNDGENDLRVFVTDMPDVAQPRGKQYWKRCLMGCWYTPVSGIWQSVYLEAAGPPSAPYITRVRVTPDVPGRTAVITVTLNRAPDAPMWVEFGLGDTVEDYPIQRDTTTKCAITERDAAFPIDMSHVGSVIGVRHWTPEHPNLYGLTVTLTRGEDARDYADRVYTYFGMRSVELGGGHVLINSDKVYQRLVLDQGYWPDTLLTPPDDEALKEDIRLTKAFGYNGARKHQKIEVPRYYYWADKMGLYVWGELPAAYTFSQDSKRNLAETMTAFIERDYNHPCIIAWTPLNESWGVAQVYGDKQQQDFARAMYYLCKSLDNTRLVSGNDGWEQVKTDIFALHDYTQDGKVLADHIKDRAELDRAGCIGKMAWAKDIEPDAGAPFMLTEYGGIAFDNKGLQGQMAGMATWGYGTKVGGEGEFLDRFARMQKAVYKTPFCRGFCYTQLTDVMQEVNGLGTPDRQPKIDPDDFAALNRSAEL